MCTLYIRPSILISFLVDCKLSEWHNCDTKCGPGNQTRTIVTQTLNSGQNCESQTKQCNLSPCPGMKLKKPAPLVILRLPTLEYFRSSRFQKDIGDHWKSKTYWEIPLGSGKA